MVAPTSSRALRRRDVVRRADDLSLDWASRVVEQVAPTTNVHSFTLEAVDSGTTTRARAKVEHNGPLPERWFIKLPSRSLRARWLTALPQLAATEIRFYFAAAADCGLSTPPMIGARASGPWRFTLVLEDLKAAGYRVGRAGDTLSAEHVLAAVRGLARMHATFLGSPRFSGDLAWCAAKTRRWEDRLGQAFAVPLMRRALKRARETIPETLHEYAMRYAARRKEAMSRLTKGPLTLVHHDCHPGNWFWSGYPSVLGPNSELVSGLVSGPASGQQSGLDQSEALGAGLFDWQLVREGAGIGDVAYLLATSVTPQERARIEWEVFKEYRNALLDAGARDLPAEAAHWTDYRAHATYAFEAMALTLGVGGLMDESAARTMLSRAVAAVQDLDSFDAVFAR